MLQEKCKTHFDSAIRARGLEYYQDKSVTILRHDEKSVLAMVKGVNTTYRVGLLWKTLGNTDIMQASCMCPYFERWGPCKHIWASILAVENGPFAHFYRGRRLEIRALPPDSSLLAGDDAVFREYSQSQWRNKLAEAATGGNKDQSTPRRGKKGRLAWYGLHAEVSEQTRMATIQLYYQEERKTGEYGKRLPLSLSLEELPLFSDPNDREILGRFCSYVPQKLSALGGASAIDQAMTAFQIHPDYYEEIFPLLAKTKRFRLTSYMSEGIEDADPIHQWQPMPGELMGRVNKKEDGFTLEPVLRPPGQLKSTEQGEPWILCECGLAMQDSLLFPLRKTQALSVIWELTQADDFEFPQRDRDQFVEEFLKVAEASAIELPEEWGWESVDVELKPILSIAAPHQLLSEDVQIAARVDYDYIIDGEVFTSGASSKTVDRENRRIFRIDLQEKEALLAPLLSSECVSQRKKSRSGEEQYEIRSSGLFDLVQKLTSEGWEVRTEKQQLRQSSGAKIEVNQSRVDWFEVGGHIEFGNEKVEFPELLKQLSRNQGYVRLESGEIGIIPKKWLLTWTKLAELSSSRGHLEFSKDQSFILDLLLQQLDTDTTQSQAFREQLKNLGELAQPQVSRAVEGFKGQLRHYQEQGLGWMEQLGRAGVGGCLADDMGLGKTVQVLALLQKLRKNSTSKLAPDLIVAPKSLVFNWGQELARFTPELKALDYTGAQREISKISQYDIIFTTYGTLRRDIIKLRDFEFNYVVLDEAHAIKNISSQSSKACRLLQARHRLALTGTPIENRLSELASLFQFLNPGLMGSKMHAVLSKEVKSDSAGRDWRPIVLQAIRPFVLRRTKKEVLPELPDKNEQVVYCQLSPSERKDYDKLRNWYRASLSKSFESQGLQHSKMHVLEALLRLRQAACHRALLSDMSHKQNLKSSKLEMLFEMLDDLTQSHKVLIFSQFTTLLAQVEKEVKEREWDYCYLDGQTSAKKRQQEVERFQNEDSARLFLLSLKAGGHGLNLTAAEYCFILDPWWNPAAEAQAVDRMYRIGQTKDVYSFRIISKDTVEEKILELQESKKNLADEFWTSGDRGLSQLNENEILELFS